MALGNGNGPFGDNIPNAKNDPQGLDGGYITAQLTTLYQTLGVTPTGPGTGATDIAYYTSLVQKTGGWFNDGTPSGNNAGYWVGRITSDVHNQQGGTSPAGGISTPTTLSQGGGANGALINKQLSLLEDDLVYRLALLAVNILQPLKDQYPNIVVVSGFRQVNTGISGHELGQAADIQIQNQTPPQLYTVADWIQKNLNFDQLILNWTDVGDQQGWIHVSFSPNSFRGQVLTKDFADAFHDGLFLCTMPTGEAAAQQLRDQAAADAQILDNLKTLQARQSRLGVAAVSANVNMAGTSTTAPTAPGTVEGGSNNSGGSGAVPGQSPDVPGFGLN